MNDNIKKLEIPLYLLALILMMSPALELAGTGWPIQLRNTEWRFGVFGLLSQALLTPIIGATIILLVTEWKERRMGKLFLAVANGLVALFVLGALPIFALDSLELRGRFVAESEAQLAMVMAAKRSLDIAVGKALVIHSLLMLYLASLAVFGFKSWRQQTGEEKRRAGEPHPLSLARLGVADGGREPARKAAKPAAATSEEAPLEPIEPEGAESASGDRDDDGELEKLDLD